MVVLKCFWPVVCVSSGGTEGRAGPPSEGSGCSSAGGSAGTLCPAGEWRRCPRRSEPAAPRHAGRAGAQP